MNCKYVLVKNNIHQILSNGFKSELNLISKYILLRTIMVITYESCNIFLHISRVLYVGMRITR